MFFNDQAARALAWSAGLLVAVGVLLFLFPFSFWTGQGGFFEKIDASQHIAGWQFYAQDEWRFPLLKTTRINYPEGVNIAFMDSIPLAALLFKPFVAWLPAQFHYIALWHILAFVGQGIAASVLIRSLGARSVFASAVAALFACLWPALMWRFGHTALMTQCLVLFGLAVYFQKRRAEMRVDTAQRYLLLLSVLGLLIHPYFFAMLYALFLFSLIEEIILQGAWRQSILMLLSSLLILGLVFYVMGYGGQHTTSFGFGEYSMNLSSPFCGSHFYSCAASDSAHQFANYHFADPTRGQYEGLNYLGLGVLALLPFGLWLQRQQLVGLLAQYRWFTVFLLGLTLYALANRVYWNDTLLLEYTVPSYLRKISDTFRSSGRFFWPVAYTLLFITLAAVLQKTTKLRVILVMCACTLQLVDTRDFSQRLTQIAKETSQGDLDPWRTVLQHIEVLHVYPAFSCGTNNENMLWYFQRLAAHYRKKIDTGYIARDQVDCRQNRNFFEADFVQDAMYVMALKDGMKAPKGFVHAVEQRNCRQWQNYLICFPTRLKQFVDTQTFFVPFTRSMQSLHWKAQDLPTQIGVQQTNGSQIVLQTQHTSGILSYGPYAQLPQADYEFVLEYEADQPREIEQATWEVWVNLPESPDHGKRLLAGHIKGSQNAVETLRAVFTIPPELVDKTVEFRTFYEGKGKLAIRSLNLNKLTAN